MQTQAVSPRTLAGFAALPDMGLPVSGFPLAVPAVKNCVCGHEKDGHRHFNRAAYCAGYVCPKCVTPWLRRFCVTCSGIGRPTVVNLPCECKRYRPGWTWPFRLLTGGEWSRKAGQS